MIAAEGRAMTFRDRVEYYYEGDSYAAHWFRYALLAFDLVTGPVLAGLHSLVTTGVPANYAEDVAQAVLMALGVPRAAARKLANLPVAAIALTPDSLLVRAQARAAQRAGA